MKWLRFLLKMVLWGTGIALVAGAVAVTVYVNRTADQIEKRFSGRLWRIPSTAYSDSTLLFPGQGMNAALFIDKLRRLGYREVSVVPRQKGQMRIGKNRIDIFLRDVETPFLKRTAFPVAIEKVETVISGITRLDTQEPLPILEIEPEELMRYFGVDRERRLLVAIGQVPAHFIQAVLAAEDRRFYRHHGIDFIGISRALVTNLKQRAIRQGGSTLTQQLAKNFFLTPERTLERKLKELVIALILEYHYEKDQILEIYLNEIYWGQRGADGINGVGEAASFYFGKTVSDLTVAESAMLAAIIRAPNHFAPHVNAKECRKRRDDVIRLMHAHGDITQAQMETALAAPLPTVNPATSARKAPYFLDYLTGQLEALYSHEDLSSDGMAIYTTLDTQVQAAAETALKHGLERLETENPSLQRKTPAERLQGAVIVIQPKTGAIVAMVGGRDYGVSQFNRASEAMRQPGSAFKPFVYAAALDTHTPVSVLSNTPRVFMVNGKPWRPKNFDNQADASVTLRKALATSQNIASINLAYETGWPRVARTVRAFGFSMPDEPYPSMVLGSTEVSPLVLAVGYCVFAADGIAPNPMALKEVVDESGSVIERRHADIRTVIDPEKAYLMSDLLKSVVTSGTARGLAALGVTWPVAGKTGTTNDSRDAWFVGYTPDILALVWVGFDNGDPIQSTGSRAAMPIWAELMRAIPQHVSGTWFDPPPGVTRRRVCSQSGALATDACPNAIEEIFLESNAPFEPCRLHGRELPKPSFWEGFRKYVPDF